MPPLETVDTPFDRDWPVLERDLAQADKISQAYTWEKVFSRMESVYEQVSR